MEIEWILLGLSVLGVVGTILNARKNILGFYVWMVSNGGMVIMSLIVPILWTQLFMWVIYFFLSLYGIMYWKKDVKA